MLYLIALSIIFSLLATISAMLGTIIIFIYDRDSIGCLKIAAVSLSIAMVLAGGAGAWALLNSSI